MKPISLGFRATLAALALASAAVAAPPIVGTVLILDNGQVIEGQIDRAGERYRIVKDGGETWLPAGRVQWVCADLTAAYQTLSGRIAATDADARLRLARWCESVGLREQALIETKAALTLKPNQAEAERYWQHLQSAPIVQVSAPPPAPPPPPVAEPPPADVGAEGLKRFTAKVQPLLMNACANCHATPAATAFKLQRVYADGLNIRTGTHWNLAAAAAQIDPARPAASKLLEYAVRAHGNDGVPPLRDKSLPAYKTLEDWVNLVAAERRPLPRVMASAKPQAAETNAEAKVEKEAGPADPFDPAIFNRQHHPNSAGPADAEPKRP